MVPLSASQQAFRRLPRRPIFGVLCGRFTRNYTWAQIHRDVLAIAPASNLQPQEVGEIAETEGHHPDISFGWGYATVSLSTKKIEGLHENDFIMASKIDRVLDRPGRPLARQ